MAYSDRGAYEYLSIYEKLYRGYKNLLFINSIGGNNSNSGNSWINAKRTFPNSGITNTVILVYGISEEPIDMSSVTFDTYKNNIVIGITPYNSSDIVTLFNANIVSNNNNYFEGFRFTGNSNNLSLQNLFVNRCIIDKYNNVNYSVIRNCRLYNTSIINSGSTNKSFIMDSSLFNCTVSNCRSNRYLIEGIAEICYVYNSDLGVNPVTKNVFGPTYKDISKLFGSTSFGFKPSSTTDFTLFPRIFNDLDEGYKTISGVNQNNITKILITYDPNGGVVTPWKEYFYRGQVFNDLPTAYKGNNHIFLCWTTVRYDDDEIIDSNNIIRTIDDISAGVITEIPTIKVNNIQPYDPDDSSDSSETESEELRYIYAYYGTMNDSSDSSDSSYDEFSLSINGDDYIYINEIKKYYLICHHNNNDYLLDWNQCTEITYSIINESTHTPKGEAIFNKNLGAIYLRSDYQYVEGDYIELIGGINNIYSSPKIIRILLRPVVVYFDKNTPEGLDSNDIYLEFDTRSYLIGSNYGLLPLCDHPTALFLGWFTRPSGGTEVKSSSIVGSGSTILYAHWDVGILGNLKICEPLLIGRTSDGNVTYGADIVGGDQNKLIRGLYYKELDEDNNGLELKYGSNIDMVSVGIYNKDSENEYRKPIKSDWSWKPTINSDLTYLSDLVSLLHSTNFENNTLSISFRGYRNTSLKVFANKTLEGVIFNDDLLIKLIINKVIINYRNRSTNIFKIYPSISSSNYDSHTHSPALTILPPGSPNGWLMYTLYNNFKICISGDESSKFRLYSQLPIIYKESNKQIKYLWIDKPKNNVGGLDTTIEDETTISSDNISLEPCNAYQDIEYHGFLATPEDDPSLPVRSLFIKFYLEERGDLDSSIITEDGKIIYTIKLKGYKKDHYKVFIYHNCFDVSCRSVTKYELPDYEESEDIPGNIPFNFTIENETISDNNLGKLGNKFRSIYRSDFELDLNLPEYNMVGKERYFTFKFSNTIFNQVGYLRIYQIGVEPPPPGTWWADKYVDANRGTDDEEVGRGDSWINPYRTIQYAVDHVVDISQVDTGGNVGGIIGVNDGIYNEHVSNIRRPEYKKSGLNDTWENGYIFSLRGAQNTIIDGTTTSLNTLPLLSNVNIGVPKTYNNSTPWNRYSTDPEKEIIDMSESEYKLHNILKPGFTIRNGTLGVKNSTIVNSIIHDNGNLGGIDNSELDIVYNCIVTNNNSVNNGGGIKGGIVLNSVISNNTSVKSGGGYYGGHILNSLIFNNESSEYGGGIYNTGEVLQCTVVYNISHNIGGVYNTTNSLISGSIVYNNNTNHNGSTSNKLNIINSCTTPLSIRFESIVSDLYNNYKLYKINRLNISQSKYFSELPEVTVYDDSGGYGFVSENSLDSNGHLIINILNGGYYKDSVIININYKYLHKDIIREISYSTLSREVFPTNLESFNTVTSFQFMILGLNRDDEEIDVTDKFNISGVLANDKSRVVVSYSVKTDASINELLLRYKSLYLSTTLNNEYKISKDLNLSDGTELDLVDRGNTSEIPLFMNTSEYDYHLKYDSPLNYKFNSMWNWYKPTWVPASIIRDLNGIYSKFNIDDNILPRLWWGEIKGVKYNYPTSIGCYNFNNNVYRFLPKISTYKDSEV